MSRKQFNEAIAIVMFLLMVGCASGSGSATPSDKTTQPTVAISPSAIPATNTPTATIEPTPTAAPSATDALSIPAPETNLPQVGPVLIFKAAGKPDGEDYLWAVSQDGMSLTRLIDEPVLGFAVYPRSSLQNGTTIVYAARSDQGASNVTLKFLRLPGGEVRTITSLVGDTFPVELPDVANLIRSIRSGGLEWSPGGSLLAFTGMRDDTWINLYTYDYRGGTVTRLANQALHALHPQWSPDGRYVVYESAQLFGEGGTKPAGMWASKYDGSSLVWLGTAAGEGIDGRSYVQIVGWLSNTEVILRSASSPSYALLGNVETGATSLAIDELFSQVAYAPEYNVWLLSQPRDSGPGTSLILYHNGERTELPTVNIDQLWWSGDYNVFFGVDADKHLYTITPTGKITEIPLENGWYGQLGGSYRFVASPDSSRWAWRYPGDSGAGGPAWVGEPMKQPDHLVSAGTTTRELYLSWTPDSRRIICLTDAGLYMAEAPDFQITPISTGLHAEPAADWEGVWVP